MKKKSEQTVKAAKKSFRQYDDTARDSVREHYHLNHIKQTVDFVRGKHREYELLNHGEMGIWQALEKLDQFIDDSDPDTELSQLQHALQTAEAARADNHPRWFILAGLIHDMGKVLSFYGEPQWAVVGDTYPVGCRFSDKIVYHDFFTDNPDSNNEAYNTKFGIYHDACGLDNVLMSWGHDEYLYLVMKNYLPEEALYILRYHSFYPCHRDGDYQYLMNAHDQEMFKYVKQFNPYDLYSKADEPPNVEKLKPYYIELINEYIPDKIRW